MHVHVLKCNIPWLIAEEKIDVAEYVIRGIPGDLMKKVKANYRAHMWDWALIVRNYTMAKLCAGPVPDAVDCVLCKFSGSPIPGASALPAFACKGCTSIWHASCDTFWRSLSLRLFALEEDDTYVCPAPLVSVIVINARAR